MPGLEGIILQYATLFGVYAIMSLSFNLEYGFSGIPNFGKILFVSLGAYASGAIAASLVLRIGASRLGMEIVAEGEPAYCTGEAKYVFHKVVEQGIVTIGELSAIFLLGIVVAVIAGVVGGIVASYPALRLGGDFLAITLLAMGEIVRLIVYNNQWPACAFDGVSGIPSPFVLTPLGHHTLFAITTLVLLFLVYLYVDASSNSPWGRVMKAVRDDEIAAKVYGYNPAKVRMKVLAVGSGLAGLAGALLVFYTGNVNAMSFKPDKTFEVIAAVMLGGSANNIGSLIGSAIIVGLLVFLNASSLRALGVTLPANIESALPYLKFTIIGIIIVAVLLFRPQGILPEQPLKTPIVSKMREILSRTSRSRKVEATSS